MTDYTLQQYLPLVSIAVWWSLAGYQVVRDRYRTWTEIFFLGECVSLGAYAASDILYFTAATQDFARTAALASFLCLTLAALFIMLFGIVFYSRMRRELFLTIVPIAIFLPILWTELVDGMTSLQGPGVQAPPWYGTWNPTVYALWVALILAYVIAGAFALFLTYREVARHTAKLRRRLQGLFIASIVAVVLALAFNVSRGITGQQSLPLFSSAVSLPGLVSWVALSPLSKERLSVAVRRWKARAYTIKMAFLIYQDGTLIGAEVAPGEAVIDQDLFSATLDVIQNFMRTSFPMLRAQQLRSIRQGEYTLVLERSHFVYLVVVIKGQENDQLRRQMRDAMLAFEAANRKTLADWRGVPAEAQGTSSMLLTLLEG